MMAVSLRRAKGRGVSALGTAAALLAVGSLAVPVWAQNSDPVKPAPAQDVQAPKENGQIVIGDDSINPNQPIRPGFVIAVSVRDEPEPSATYQVDRSGNISMKYAGVMTPISVMDMTPAQAADAVSRFLKAYVKNPVVTVSIVDVPRPKIFVGGPGVKNPGPVVITEDTTLVDVLSRLGWAENADLTQVRVTRTETVNGEEKQSTRFINFDRYIKLKPGQQPDETDNPVLREKDRLFVAAYALPGTGKVSALGEVTKPAPDIPLRTSGPSMTVRELINIVGGTTLNANRKNVVIRRAGLDRPLVIDLEKAEQGDMVHNIELRPDDTVYVEKLENNAYLNMNGGFVKSGKLIYDRRMTLTQAIQESGGVAPFSRLDIGRIFRHPTNDPKDTTIQRFNWKRIMDGTDPDIELLPGDSVYIQPGQPPKAPIDLFTIINALSQGVFLYNNLTGNFWNGNNNGFFR